MNKFFLVLGHTYWTRLKSKAFIITTSVLLLLVLGIANIESIIKIFDSEKEAKEVIVINESPLIYSNLASNLEGNDRVRLIEYEKDIADGEKEVKKEKYDALLVIKEDENALPNLTYYAQSIAADETLSILESNLQMIKDSILIEKSGIDEGTLAEMNQPVKIEKHALDESAKTDEELDLAYFIYGYFNIWTNDCNRHCNRKIFACYGDFNIECFTGNTYVCKNNRYCFIRDYSSWYCYCRWFIIPTT